MSILLKDNAFAIIGWVCTISAILAFSGTWLLYRGIHTQHPSSLLRRFVVCALGGVALSLSLVGGGSLWLRYRPQPPDITRPLFAGALYHRFSRTAPRPFVAHTVTVDLQTPGLRFLVTPGEPGECVVARTTSNFLEHSGASLAINTHFFRTCKNSTLVTPLGISIANGKTISSTPWNGNTLFVDSEERVTLSGRPEQVQFAISGRNRLIRSGESTGADDGFLAPRLAMGLDADAQTLIIALVDGRQRGYSEGVSLGEMAVLMLELGAHDAIELDGGGSATLAERSKNGAANVLNSPIHSRIPGRERPVANHFGIAIE